MTRYRHSETRIITVLKAHFRGSASIAELALLNGVTDYWVRAKRQPYSISHRCSPPRPAIPISLNSSGVLCSAF